jgi:predicted permease
MTWRDLQLRLRALVLRRRTEQELDEELAFHIEREAHQHIAAGMSRDEALALARLRFGSQPRAADECRDVRGTATIDALARDVVYALRTCRRAPLASLTIVATIALGLALVTVAFTVYNAIFLRVDAVRHPDELVAIERPEQPDMPRGGMRSLLPFSRREYEILRRDSGVLTDAAMTMPIRPRVEGQSTNGALVTGNFFQMLGVGPALGRTLTPADDDPASGHQVIVLSARGWRRLFQNDPTIVGRSARLDGVPYDVVGVMPADFRGLNVVAPDFWAPFSLASQFSKLYRSDDTFYTSTIGRLKPGVTREAAEAALTAWASGRTDIRKAPRRAPGRFELYPDRGTMDPDDYKAQILPIAFSFGLMLLIACANVANMLLARGVSRQREIGVRLSLGASRWRVVRQLLIESLVLAFAAAAFGALLSRLLLEGALSAANAAMSAEAAARVSAAPLSMDWRILLFLVIGAIVSTMLFGLAPALRATRIELVRTMRGDVAKHVHPAVARRALITLQAGGAVLLLISAAVFLQNAFSASRMDFGLRTSDTLTIPIIHEPLRAAMLQEIEHHPAVASVAAASGAVGGNYLWYSDVETSEPVPEGARPDATEARRRGGANYGFVSPNYFDTLGIDMVQGRAFTDTERTLDAGVAIVSERFARELWPTRSAVGQTIRFEAAPPHDPRDQNAARVPPRSFVVVGVAHDVGWRAGNRFFFLAPGVYVPIDAHSPFTSLAVRVHGDPDTARKALLDRLVAIDPALGDIITLRSTVSTVTFGLWIAFWLTVIVAGLALLVTASGLFSVLSYLVEERKKDIGVRMALGATMRNIAGWVFLQMLMPVSVAIVAGGSLVTPLVKMIARWSPFDFASMTRVFDPLTFGASVTFIIAVCVLAAAVPALRAARVDPIETLRND